MQIILTVTNTKDNKASLHIDSFFFMKMNTYGTDGTEDLSYSPTIKMKLHRKDDAKTWLNQLTDKLSLDGDLHITQIRCINPKSPWQYWCYARALTDEVANDMSFPLEGETRHYMIDIDLFQKNR